MKRPSCFGRMAIRPSWRRPWRMRSIKSMVSFRFSMSAHCAKPRRSPVPLLSSRALSRGSSRSSPWCCRQRASTAWSRIRTQLRTHEIGIRVRWALRAPCAAARASAGTVAYADRARARIALLVGLTRFIAGLLYGISANDPVTIVCMTALLAVAAILACCFPALKAMRVEPVDAIRTL